MKECYTCKQSLALSSFPRNRYGKDGTRNQCKTCKNKEMIESEYRRKNNRKVQVRFIQSRASAKRRDLIWNITESEHEAFLKKPCFYCNSQLSPTGVGLDRIDSSLGYTPENVNPCCRTCNIMKNSLSVEDFYNHIAKIFENKNKV